MLLIERFTRGDIALRLSFYSLSERIASSLGLFSWSLILYLTSGNYRLSALLMLVFPILGFIIQAFKQEALGIWALKA